MSGSSLYDRLGGEAAVDLAVDRFYTKVLADSRIARFFARTDMVRQHAHQKAFLTYAFGGSAAYGGRGMRAAHAGMGLTDLHFDAVMENLAAALRDLGIAEALIAEVAATAETVRADVLGR